jgi:tetratricopeptide (TPR) repeat protein
MLALEKLPLIIITIISCAATLFAQKTTVAPFDAFPLWVRIQNALFSCTMYLAQTFWPVDMAIFYPHQESFLEFWKALVAGIILLTVSVIIYKYRNKWRYCVTGWLWYLIALLPVIGLVQVGAQARADRYTYVPLIGFFTAFCFLVYSLTSGKKKLSAAAVAIGFAVCAVLGMVTYKQVGYWKNNFTLFNHALDVTGGSGMAYNNLGVAYAEKGQFADAERYFNLALTLSNTDYESNYNIAKMLVGLKRYPEAKMYIDKLMTWNGNTSEVYNLYVDYMRGQGDMKNAEKVYVEAIIREPNDPTLHNGYGIVLADMQRYDDAIMEFIKSIDLQPTADAFVNLGAALSSKGDVNGGIAHFESALKIDKKNASAYYHLGNAYFSKQSFEKAVDNFQLALKNDPNYFKAHGNLAVSLAQMGKLDEAIEHMQKVTAFDPNNPDGYFNLGLALMDAKRYREAQVPLEALTKLEPSNPDNYIYLGNAFYEQKDLENAAKAYQKALSIDPNHPKAKEGLQKISSGR